MEQLRENARTPAVLAGHQHPCADQLRRTYLSILRCDNVTARTDTCATGRTGPKLHRACCAAAAFVMLSRLPTDVMAGLETQTTTYSMAHTLSIQNSWPP